MSKLFLDWQVWLAFVLVFIVGVICGFDISSPTLSGLNVSAWLAALATTAAVIVALYTARLNVSRDTHKLVCTYTYQVLPILSFDKNRNFEDSIKKHLTIKIVNMGLRPIALRGLIIRNIDNTIKDLHYFASDSKNGSVTGLVIPPGDFYEADLNPEYLHCKDYNIDENSTISIVDALDVIHPAQHKKHGELE